MSNEKDFVVEVLFKDNNNFVVKFNGCQKEISPTELNSSDYKYHYDFCRFFRRAVDAPAGTAIMFFDEASEAIDIIQNFNRIVF